MPASSMVTPFKSPATEAGAAAPVDFCSHPITALAALILVPLVQTERITLAKVMPIPPYRRAIARSTTPTSRSLAIRNLTSLVSA